MINMDTSGHKKDETDNNQSIVSGKVETKVVSDKVTGKAKAEIDTKKIKEQLVEMDKKVEKARKVVIDKKDLTSI